MQPMMCQKDFTNLIKKIAEKGLTSTPFHGIIKIVQEREVARMGKTVEMKARREQMMSKIVCNFGLEDERTVEFCKMAECECVADWFLELVYDIVMEG